MPVFVIIFAILLLGDVTCALSADTASKAPDAEFLRGFLGGEYDLIGRKADSVTLYTGRVTIRDVGGTLEITRVIDGKTERGTISLIPLLEPIVFQFFGRTLAWTDESMRLHTSGDAILITIRD